MANPRNISTEALVIHKPGDNFVMEPITLDEVRSDEVLVEMKYSGICHTVCHPPLLDRPEAVSNPCRMYFSKQAYFQAWSTQPSLATRVRALSEH